MTQAPYRPFSRAAGFAVLATTSLAGGEPRVAVSLPATFVAGDRALLVPSPGARGDGLLRAAALLEYARNPLSLVEPSQERRSVVEQQLWLHAVASFALHHRWLAAVDVPLLLQQQGDPEAFAPDVPAARERVALGDPRLQLRGRVWGDADGLAFGLGARGSLPVAGETYAGGPGPALGAFASAGHDRLSSFWAVSVGVDWRESQTLPGILPTRRGPSLELAAAWGVTLDAARSARLGPELALSSAVSEGARLLDPRSTVCQLLLHLQWRLSKGPFELGIAGGPALGRAPGAADYRALLSLSFSPEAPVPPPDADSDRVADSEDMCPSLAGVMSEDPIMHGCPALPSDADGDGIPDTMDACPRTVGEPSVVRRRHGCPPAPEPPPQPAAPPQPTEPKAELEQTQITISEQVQFETGTAQIREQSSAILQQVANVLKQHPEITSLEVAGHTDDTGTSEVNRELSLARARAVVDWLVAHGIEARRLSAQGYGATRPLADNTTEEGRGKNRRVEFLIQSNLPPAREQP